MMNLELCLEFLDYFGIDYSGNTIELDSGSLSVVMNMPSKFTTFVGYSVREVGEWVAEELGKEITWADESY